MFNIILAKPSEIVVKLLLKIWQKFGKDFTRFLQQIQLWHILTE